jgi:hypothetical protein
MISNGEIGVAAAAAASAVAIAAFGSGAPKFPASDDHRRSSHDADRGDKSYSPHCQSPSSTGFHLP